MKKLFRQLGPGLLYAGAAVGVSHLVQSTRAGADYGLWMIAVVLIANFLKYPFFKAGPLFAVTTEQSLLEAFYKIGNWAVLLFYGLTFTTMFAVQAVVTLITASVLASIFNLSIPLWIISAVILLCCAFILLMGKFHLLNKVMRYVIVLLAITTLISLFAAIFSYSDPAFEPKVFSFFHSPDLFFLIALVGWMPAPLDISVWHSEWTLAEIKEQQNKHKNFSGVHFDFKVGYWGTTFLAMAFVALGALMLRGRGIVLSDRGAEFAGDVIGMYTATLGKWAFVFVAMAALTTMFSTTLTVLDAYPRVLSKALALSFKNLKISSGKLYFYLLSLTVVGALFILIFQLENMKQLVDFATGISFLTAPVLGSLIYKVVLNAKGKIFSTTDHSIAIIGLIFLYAFSIYYLWMKYFLN